MSCPTDVCPQPFLSTGTDRRKLLAGLSPHGPYLDSGVTEGPDEVWVMFLQSLLCPLEGRQLLVGFPQFCAPKGLKKATDPDSESVELH